MNDNYELTMRCPYNIDDRDDAFLQKLNEDHVGFFSYPNDSQIDKLNESGFEEVVWSMERCIMI